MVQVMNGVRYPSGLRDAAIRLYLEEEISAADVARRLGLGRHTVKDWLRARGLARSMSEAAALSVRRKPRGVRGTRIEWRSTKTGRIEIADSTYEAARMDQLDDDNEVLDWWRCHDRIPYTTSGNKTRFYVPDLSILLRSGQRVVEEVKPARFVKRGSNPAKFAAAQRHYERQGINYRIVTEAEIGSTDRQIYERYRPDAEQAAKRHAEKVRASRARREASETPEQRRARLDHLAAKRRRLNAARRAVETIEQAETRRAKHRAAYARRQAALASATTY